MQTTIRYFLLAIFMASAFEMVSQTRQDAGTIAYDSGDNSWRVAAEERIEKHRKAGLRVNVADPLGNPVSGATVKVQMTKHAFGFGALMNQVRWDDIPNPELAGKNLELAEKYFNKVVTIPAINPTADRMLEWLNSRDIEVRGHYLMWARIQPGYRRGQPENMPEDQEVLRKMAFEYIEKMLTWADGRFTEWDVINHIVTSSHMGFDQLFGFSFFADIIHFARKIAPGVEMWVNEGGILWGDAPRAMEYLEVVRKLVDLGAAPDGVGFMAHFRENELIRMDEIYRRLEKFAELVPNLQLTEFDIDVADKNIQVSFLRDIMTLSFSHPAVSGIIMWNVMGGTSKALWNADWTPNKAGEAWIDLVHNQWWTNEEGKTSAKGEYALRGFLGDYEITVQQGSEIKTVKSQLTADGQTVNVVLP